MFDKQDVREGFWGYNDGQQRSSEKFGSHFDPNSSQVKLDAMTNLLYQAPSFTKEVKNISVTLQMVVSSKSERDTGPITLFGINDSGQAQPDIASNSQTRRQSQVFKGGTMVLLVALLAGVAVLVTGSEPPHQLLCPEGWTDTIGECVKVFHERQNWLLARKICQANGGDLLGSKYHQDLNTHLLRLLEDGNTGGLWIGLYAPSGRNSLRFVDGPKPDEGTKTLREYRVTPTERNTREKRCVKLSHKNTWVGIKCTAIDKFICEKPYYELQCPNGWMVSPWSASCIRLERKKKSWDDARGRCHELGADLVKIVNDKMNQLITTYMLEKPRTGYWIGLRNRFDFDGNEFKWLDEQYPAKYTHLGESSVPKPRFPANRCAVVS
ncbi:hypothetical protein RRG08_048334 [Elysia crispata]|uniref:C-type lectin domain-containing protein n=1 Tax=Elysia crispata TaxID=231223 RepID=A0AAE1D0D2_9GAST|nr:hypothetical protein RRG08_048334 [Elysia crispata]